MRKNEESLLQRACVKWFRLKFPKYLIFAIPNGGSRNLFEAKNMKLEGTLPGVADLQIIMNKKTFFIEMKAREGKQSLKQKEFENKVKEQGFDYFICRSFDEFKKIIENNE